MALSDQDVQQQIKQMMAFINQEADEKAAEIDAKAEEEFNIEKGKYVQQQRVKIMEYYDRKEKQIELNIKIQNSNMLNQARLKILKAREDHIKELMDEASKRLGEIRNDEEVYKKLLQDLITQGMTQLLEENIVVKCKEEDVEFVKEVIPKSVKAYKEIYKNECKPVLDTENFLPPDIAGGVELCTANEQVKLENTLESRLRLIGQQMLPELRVILFGENANRKFFD